MRRSTSKGAAPVFTTVEEIDAEIQKIDLLIEKRAAPVFSTVEEIDAEIQKTNLLIEKINSGIRKVEVAFGPEEEEGFRRLGRELAAATEALNEHLREAERLLSRKFGKREAIVTLPTTGYLAWMASKGVWGLHVIDRGAILPILSARRGTRCEACHCLQALRDEYLEKYGP